jgi:hypothetical protein
VPDHPLGTSVRGCGRLELARRHHVHGDERTGHRSELYRNADRRRHRPVARVTDDEPKLRGRNRDGDVEGRQGATDDYVRAAASPIATSPPPVTLIATASSGLAVGFSVVAEPAMVNGSILTLTGAGTVIVAANQAVNAQYAAGPTVTQTVQVDPQPTVTLTATPNPVLLNNAVTFTATLSLNGPPPRGR